jgi:hypothetical protein
MSTPTPTPDSPSLDLHHPTPDLQSLQGAYVGNIERLEDHAERMSEKGSDLGEEIRKLHMEQKLSDSRRSSLYSIPSIDEPARVPTTRSRNASTSSYANSIVDLNGAARWGGYSPGGYVTPPVGSLRSTTSFSHAVPLQRQRSGSRASRLGQVVHAEENEEEAHQPGVNLGSPRSYTSAQPSAQRDTSPPASRRSISSFTRHYDQIAQEIQHEFQLPAEEDMHKDNVHRHLDLPDRPPTAASTDTTHQARTLWQDFDGVHGPETVPEEDLPLSQGSRSRTSSLMKPAPQMPPQSAPPPDEGMVFYPAPVPRMLNLPKRLSKVPVADIQARRRTQLLESMQAENRKSAPWLAEGGVDPPNENRKSMDPLRKSRQSLANLPPQLRASAYFDQVAAAQEFEVKGDSAKATLDSILDASAHAPVSAFTDHPYAGQVGDEVYGKERHTRQSSRIIDESTDKRKSRSSLNLLNTRRNSNGDTLKKLKKRNSSADLNMLTVRASESRMSLGAELEDPDHDMREPNTMHNHTPTEDFVDHDPERHSEHETDVAAEEAEFEDNQYFGPPTTLLAELQMRKQQQKTRNLNAATAFTNGMHSTLLELDAVAEVEKKKRLGQKVNLAWEAAPPTIGNEEDSDDEVPLGVLYPGHEGLINQTRPKERLGLIAQRQLEDTEPLSQRRSRIIGVDPRQRRSQIPAFSTSQQHLAVPTSTTPQPESDEDEGETLAQRMRRMKNRQTLDNALGDDVRKSVISGDFASEMMSQFGVPGGEEDKAKPSPSPGLDEEETLGQRRARLQAEAIARGDVDPTNNRPALRSSMSLADVLAAHPVDNTVRKVSDEALVSAMPGSLLHQSAIKQSKREASRIDLNRRISSFGALDQPLLGDVSKQAPEQAVGARIQAYKDKMAGLGTPNTAPLPSRPSMMFTPMSGITPAMSGMQLPTQRDSYFPQANIAMNGVGLPPAFQYPGGPMMHQQQMMPTNMGMMGTPMGGMPPMAYPYQQMGGVRQSSMMSLPMNSMQSQMLQQQAMMMEPPMDPRQRAVIDSWRNGVV